MRRIKTPTATLTVSACPKPLVATQKIESGLRFRVPVLGTFRALEIAASSVVVHH